MLIINKYVVALVGVSGVLDCLLFCLVHLVYPVLICSHTLNNTYLATPEMPITKTLVLWTVF